LEKRNNSKNPRKKRQLEKEKLMQKKKKITSRVLNTERKIPIAQNNRRHPSEAVGKKIHQSARKHSLGSERAEELVSNNEEGDFTSWKREQLKKCLLKGES